MTYSILLSLSGRDPIDLQKTFAQLAKASAGREEDLEFCIVIDGKPDQYESDQALAEIFEESVDCRVKLDYLDTQAKHPETFHLGTHNNPVAVNNKLMDMAEGDNLIWISSDMIVSPLLLSRIDLHIEKDTNCLDTVWCSRVLDQDGMAEFCGPSRPFPMMWCIAHPHTGERHDLQLLQGFGFDDNDWVARMALRVGSVTIDLCHIAIHQTHGRVSTVGQLASGKAYSVDAQPGWERSTKYMQAKWGGVPFDGKTLDVEFGEVGEFMVLNVNGVKTAGCPLRPDDVLAALTEEPDPIGKPKPKRKRKAKATKKKKATK